MTTYTGAVFNNGAVSRLIDVAIDAREAATPTPVEEEISRFCRIVENSREASWAIPLATVSALLDFIVESVRGPHGYPVPAGFTDRLTRAAGTLPGPEFLTTIAGLIRTLDQQGVPSFRELPMASWEAQVRFSRLREFSWWVEGDEYNTFEEGVKAGIESEHPYGCARTLPPLTAEIQEALLLISESDGLESVLRTVIPWASAPVLRDILQLANMHMSEQH